MEQAVLLLMSASRMLLVREKSKDIVALLTDDNLLSQARRSKNPPIDRRPQSIGPLTIDKADMKSRPPL